jgi:hypothetical protein
MLRVVLVTAACGGCFASVPDSVPVNAAPGIDVGESETEILGRAGFSMTFASTGVRLPISLVHGTEVFGTNTCPSPSRAGVSIEPFATAVGGEPAVGSAVNTYALALRGPAVVQVAVGYEVPYDCDGKQSLRGTSTFTLFPSGRIVRNDAVRASTGLNIADATACAACDGIPRQAALHAFWALDAKAGERFEVTDTAIARNTTASIPFSCAKYLTHTAAISWSGDLGTAPARTSDTPSTFVYAYDFFTKSSTVPQAEQTARSTMLVAPNEQMCADMFTRLQLPATIVVDDGGVTTDARLDAFEIYRADGTHRGRIELRPPAGEAVPDGFAIDLDIGSIEHLRVERRSNEPIASTVQREGARSIIWIEDGIAAGDAIIIEAL